MYPPRAEIEAGKTHVGSPHNLSDIADGRDDEPRAERHDAGAEREREHSAERSASA